MWKWSVDHPEEFWSKFWDYSKIIGNKGEEIIVLTREVDGVIRITQPIYTNNTIETITDQKPSEITFGDGTGSRITIIQQ